MVRTDSLLVSDDRLGDLRDTDEPDDGLVLVA
jgi:hypothetical protein